MPHGLVRTPSCSFLMVIRKAGASLVAGGQESAYNAETQGLIPGLRRFPEEGKNGNSTLTVFTWEIPWTEGP